MERAPAILLVGLGGAGCAMVARLAPGLPADVQVLRVDTDARLVAAPDDQGRSLAAVFTHADAFDAFAEETNDDDLRSVTLTGVELFEQIREMDLDGVMFDCSGPGLVLVFDRAFAEDVVRVAGA